MNMEQKTKAGPCGFHGRILELAGSLGFLMALHEVQGLFLPVVPSVRRRLTDVLVNQAEASWIARMESWAADRSGAQLTAEERTGFALAAGNAEVQWLNEMLDDREAPIRAVSHAVRDRMQVHRLRTDALSHLGMEEQWRSDAERESRLEFVCECLVHGLRPATASPWTGEGVESRLSTWVRDIASGLWPHSGEGGFTDQDSAILKVAGNDRDLLVDTGRAVARMRGLGRLEPRGELQMLGLDHIAVILGGRPASTADEFGQEVFAALPAYPARTMALMNRRRELFKVWARQTGVEFSGPFGGPRKPVLEALADA